MVESTVTSIAAAARRNAAGAEQVAAAGQEQNASVQEIAAASAGLAQIAVELKRAVQEFKVQDNVWFAHSPSHFG